MRHDYDVIIAGAGLAGACAAYYLSRTYRVVVLEATTPASGASAVAAGLINPLPGRRARAAWRLDDALAILNDLADAIAPPALFQEQGLLRPARSAEQAEHFIEAARSSGIATWIPPASVSERWPWMRVSEGVLQVHRGGAVSIPALVEALLVAAEKQGATVRNNTRVIGWGRQREGAFAEVVQGNEPRRYYARHLLLAMGWGLRSHSLFDSLKLHGVKGQTIRIQAPAALPLNQPVAGIVHLVPDGASIVIGSTYEHIFSDLTPSSEQTDYLLSHAAFLIPALSGSPLLWSGAGVRITTRSRLPLLGPITDDGAIWVFTGLGSKGLLTAPLLGSLLPEALHNPAGLPHGVHPPK